MKANELSAKDLMIGDWVQGNPCGQHCDRNNNTYYKIATLDIGNHCWGYSVCGAIVELKYDDIFPIPLTPEILEKNRFLYNQDYNVWVCFVNEITITVGIYHPDFISIGYEQHTPDGVDKGELSSICKVDGSNFYVHQLQHALRLCWIEKEIIL